MGYPPPTLRPSGGPHTAVRAVGYRQLWSYFDGEYSLEQAREKGIIATRQLAKRQFTWLRSWPHLHWFDTLNAAGEQREQSDILNEVGTYLAEQGISA